MPMKNIFNMRTPSERDHTWIPVKRQNDCKAKEVRIEGNVLCCWDLEWCYLIRAFKPGERVDGAHYEQQLAELNGAVQKTP